MSDGFSVVVTVRNDRAGLEVLLPALAAQTRPPDEVVVVDGGSTDGTVEALESWRPGFPVRVELAEGANISAGRNVGIRAARHEWIALTDAGCRPSPGWLAAFDRARDGCDFVGGIYVVCGETPFEQALAAALYPVAEELGDEPDGLLLRAAHRLFGRRFQVTHATGRSMAFKSAVWQAVGGFDEDLYAGEDVNFSSQVVDRGFSARLAPEAAVDWRPRPTVRANARMYVTYARGDVRAAPPWRHLVRASAWVAGPALVAKGGPAGRVAAGAAALAYLGLPLLRAHRRGLGPAALGLIPFVVALKDLSQLAGAVAGIADGMLDRAQPSPVR